MSEVAPLTHPLLAEVGIEHGFGVRGFVAPPGLRRPKQVHGRVVVNADALSGDIAPQSNATPSTPSTPITPSTPSIPSAETLDPPGPVEADAVVSDQAGVGVAVVTADCVPILLADPDAGVVAAVHAGWKGLVGGVIGAGVTALSALGADPSRSIAVIGPYVGSCCYEVDEPVLSEFDRRFAATMEAATRATRAGHARIDLGLFAVAELTSVGLTIERVGRFEGLCTSCDRQRFHSYRRDGALAGRMIHFIRAPERRLL